MPAELTVAVDPTIVARVSRMVHKTSQRPTSHTSYSMVQGGSSEDRMLGLLGDIFHSSNLDSLAKVMCRDLPMLIGARHCSIYLKHCTHKTLMCFTSNGSKEVDYDSAEGIPATVLETGQSIKSVIQSEGNNGEHNKGATSSLALPIICRNGERFGVLLLSEKIGADASDGFSTGDEVYYRVSSRD